jgi:hypothetical protein
LAQNVNLSAQVAFEEEASARAAPSVDAIDDGVTL